MLRFKQYINYFLAEAKAEHFAHIGLDVSNPKHKDMLDMFNKYTHMMPKKNANQYKSLDELQDAVKPHLDELKKQRESEKEHQAAIKRGDAELVHHDPEKGIKVFKVRNQRGSCAVGKGTQWCVAQDPEGEEMKRYDPTGNYSHVIHLDKEKGNLSRIGIIGVKPNKPHTSGMGGNFQDKGNNTVSDENWNRLKKKYDLDNVESLEGVRGIPLSEKTKQKIKGKGEDLSNKIKNGTHKDEDLYHAIDHGYLKPKHIKDLNGTDLNKIADKSDDPEIHKAIINHPKADNYILAKVGKKSKDTEIHKSIVNHPKAGDEALYSVFDRSDETDNDPEIHKAIVNNPKASDNTLSSVAYVSKDPEIHKAILNHPETGGAALSYVAQNSNDPEIHKAIINHPNTDSYVLSGVASVSKDPEIHKAILNHPNADSVTLSHVAEKSDDQEVHKAILNHPKVGEETKKSLIKKQSDNPYIL